MAPVSRKTIRHFTHGHPLTEVYANTEFLCHGCRTPGIGTRYRCESCDFDLHDHCATCPMELSSFMHEHQLKLVLRKPKTACRNDRICDLCGDPVEGIFYRCKLCEFDVHPPCTQLPEYVRHAMHKDHPLRLQRAVPGMCMVCKDTCMSWHYRCGLCCFDLHLECVLEVCCDEEEASTSTTTPRSFRKPVPPPSPSNSFPNHAYGGFQTPPNYYANYAYGYGVPPTPPYFCPYAHGYGNPSSFGEYNVDGHLHNNNSNVHGTGGKVRKKMYQIAGKLVLGVISNVVFGTLFQ